MPGSTLRCELIDVQLGVAATSLEPAARPAGQELQVTSSSRYRLRHLNEDGVPELEAAVRPPQATDWEPP